MSEGKLPFNPEEEDHEPVKDLGEEDIEAALERLTAFEEDLRQDNVKGKLPYYNFIISWVARFQYTSLIHVLVVKVREWRGESGSR